MSDGLDANVKDELCREYVKEIMTFTRIVFEASDMSFVFFDELNNIVIIYKDLFAKRSLIISYEETTKELLIAS